jgi:hypothetical protein
MREVDLTYAYCFCGKTIRNTLADVCELRFATAFDDAKKYQEEQFFFCHSRCFRNRLVQSVLYVVDLVDDEIQPSGRAAKRISRLRRTYR